MNDTERQFEKHIAEALAEADASAPSNAPAGPARVLVAAADAQVRCAAESLLKCRGHQCTCVARLDEARTALSRNRFEMVLLAALDTNSDAVELLRLLARSAPTTKTIIVAQGVTASLAVQAMRCGAVDVLSLPLDPNDFVTRVDAALQKSRREQDRELRLTRLRKICQELNGARQEIARQVDTLADDLSHVYSDIAEQMSDVAMAAEFRTLLRQELDVEDLLRTTLEYMLTKTGPTNAAVFLPDGSSLSGEGGNKKKHVSYGLGAYVNYDCPRETVSAMLDHLCGAICPQMVSETEIVSFDDAGEFSEWIGVDAEFLADSHIIAFSCLHKGDCMAVIVLFRGKSQRFDERTAGMLDTLRTIIAEQLRTVVKVHHRASDSAWPRDIEDEDDLEQEWRDEYGFGGHEGGLAA
jgi:DNA-binding response OmpR family regulator